MEIKSHPRSFPTCKIGTKTTMWLVEFYNVMKRGVSGEQQRGCWEKRMTFGTSVSFWLFHELFTSVESVATFLNHQKGFCQMISRCGAFLLTRCLLARSSSSKPRHATNTLSTVFQVYPPRGDFSSSSGMNSAVACCYLSLLKWLK